MTSETPQSDTPAPPKPSRSKKLLKILFWFGLTLLILLFCAGLLLTYWFPSEMVRQELEVRLSRLLEGTVRIQSLSFNALTGLQVSQLKLAKPDQPPLTLVHLTLDYSLLGLLTGSLTINEITIDQADLTINVPELTKGPPEPTPPPSEPPALPAIPVSIDLETFRIIDSNIRIILTRDFIVQFSNLNFSSSGSVSSEDARLDGFLQVEQLALALQDKNLHLPLDMDFDLAVHLPTEHLDLARLTIESKPAFRLTLSGTLEKFLSDKRMNLSLTETRFDLGKLLILAKDFIPPEYGMASVQGELSPSVILTGALPDSGFHGRIQAELDGKNLEMHLPERAVAVGPTDLEFTAKDVQIKENIPLTGTIAATLSAQHLAYEAYGIKGFDVLLNGDYQAAGPFSTNLKISGTTSLPRELIGKPANLPFAIAFDSNGNYRTRHVQVKKLHVDLNPYGALQAKAALVPFPSPKEGMEASLEARLSPGLKALLSLVPQDRLQGLDIQKGTEPDNLIVKAEGVLHPDFRPEWGKATAALKISSLRAGGDALGAEGTLHQLTFLLSSAYKEHQGAVQGTAGLSTRVSNLRTANGIGLGTGHLILKSNFQGHLSPDFQPTAMRSQDQLQLTLGSLTYQDPSLKVTLPSLRLSAKTKEDVFNHIYLLESLRLTSDQILDMDLKGRYNQGKQQFEVDLQIPLLHVGNLLPHLSGPLMQGVEEIHPKGRVSLVVRAAGNIPQAADFEKYTLPLGVHGRLMLQDLAGAVGGYQVREGNGTITVAYSPKATPQTQLISDVTLSRIHLPEFLPISQLSDTSLHASIMAPDLNEVHIDPVHLKAKGFALSLKGAVVGVREMLSSSLPFGSQLAKLFAQLQTNVDLDLGSFQEALQPLGMQGTGKTTVSLSLLKKEQGNMQAAVQLATDHLSLTRQDLQLQDMSGTIQVRKSLVYKPDGLPHPLKNIFQPSDRIAQLKSYSPKGQALTIERLQAGPFTIRNFSTNLAFEQEALKMQNLAMNLLGGGIGGHIIIAAEHPLRISAELEVANLDANQLLETQAKISGDSQIAATLSLTTLLQEKTGAVDLSRLDLTLHITHIGKEALDRLLVFLDPEGSNPTISNARAQLSLANPSRVTVEVVRGQLSLTIHFQGGLLSKFKLERIPIAKMKNIEKMTAAIPNWEDLTQILKLVGAKTYSFTPEGGVVIQ